MTTASWDFLFSFHFCFCIWNTLIIYLYPFLHTMCNRKLFEESRLFWKIVFSNRHNWTQAKLDESFVDTHPVTSMSRLIFIEKEKGNTSRAVWKMADAQYIISIVSFLKGWQANNVKLSKTTHRLEIRLQNEQHPCKALWEYRTSKVPSQKMTYLRRAS